MELVDGPSLINVGRDDIILPNHLTERLLSDDRAFAASGMLSRIAQGEMAYQKLGRDRMAYQSGLVGRGMAINYDAVGQSVANHLQKLPFDKVDFDERGFTRTIVEGTSRRILKNQNRYLGRR